MDTEIKDLSSLMCFVKNILEQIASGELEHDEYTSRQRLRTARIGLYQIEQFEKGQNNHEHK